MTSLPELTFVPMQRADIRPGTIFRRVRENRFYKITYHKYLGLQIHSYFYPSCPGDGIHEGFLKLTESDMGFTMFDMILYKQVFAFFHFKDHEVLQPK